MKQELSNDEIMNGLLQNRNLSMVLYVLSEIPSYPDELSKELNISKNEILDAISYLKKNKLIQEFSANGCKSSDFYPLILKKLKTMTEGLSSAQRKEMLAKISFYHISRKGHDFLPYARKCAINNKRGDSK
jgi:predicted transcriptional regulator